MFISLHLQSFTAGPGYDVFWEAKFSEVGYFV